ncbi:phospholipase B1, membrane-associated [Sinocyclocheilus anshuiensis]|uniref:phospholipase B1, membrane-associated n=1 Tax=Sinocyclocheilus anshuiensis TaxID=1608454 RepID=UPI0007BA326A|nr:PREDICTED: phospholipase B1, membrane-associated-like [Sinocyclocheilus anshuiensis]
MNQAKKRMILSIMGIKDKTFSSCAQIMILALLACRCSAVESLYCAVSSPSPSTPVSVHSMRPADVSVLSALVLSDVKRSDEIRALNMLSEILFTFNPDVSAVVPEQRSLMDKAEYIMESLSSTTQWKLLLLFIPVDELSVCTDQDLSATIDATVNRVEQILDSLHKKLKHTLVHVVVWSELSHDRVCQFQCEEGYDENRRRLDTIVLMALLQESVSALLERRGWFGDREDFSVMLQSSPVHTELSNPMKASTSDSSRDISLLTLQLWTNLLQPMTDKTETNGRGIFTIPCPTEEKPFLRTQENSYSPELGNSQTEDPSPLLHPVMGSELTCEDRSPSPSIPTSVHALRPADIKVVAAMGDSLTAANGVGAAQNNLLGVLTEYRGLSWSIGGDENLTTTTTLPNILREFNPSITGYSVGKGSENSALSFLNQAVPGATSDDMVTQAHAVIKRMKEDSLIDFQNDWKIITVFIGGNDICAHCSDTRYYSPDNIVKYIREGLDILHKEVPRALVNLVELLDIIPLRRLHQDPTLGCPTWMVNMLCRCVLKPKDGSHEFQMLQEFNQAYQRGMRELLESGRYDTHDNFTVVLQPFFRNVFLPVLEDGRPDRSYFSPDCFHLSQKAHTLMARALWNNLMEPLGNKTDSEDFSAGVPLKCPEKSSPYLRTYHNSNYTYNTPPPTPPPANNWGTDFSCVDTVPSDTVPTSVHRLRPGDIKVVASLGDSITAGFGAKAENLLQLADEERGVSWSIGGDDTLETVTTLPNILKKFNPNVFGFSKGKSKRPNGFNMAVSGAKANNIPAQVRDLITALKDSTKVDFEKDWKLVTLFIGGNDLCQYCHDRASLSPSKYIGHIIDSLDMLYNEVPRVLVNFVGILEITDLRMIKRNTLGCSLLQENMCPCFLEPRENSPEMNEMKKVNRDLQMETERLVYGGRYDGRQDFAVLLQPFFKNSVVPMVEDGTPDLTFFSVDCFHFSERGHAEMALALWNNMLEPVDSKQTYNNFTYDRSKIQCPTKEHPFIFTRINSGSDVLTTVVPATVAPGTPLPADCPNDAVPAWAAAVLAVGGLIIGWVVTWMIFYFRERKNRKRNESTEINGTKF